MSNESEIREILNTAKEQSEIVRVAAAEAVSVVNQMKADQDALLERNKILSEEYEISIEDFKNRVIKDIDIASTITTSLKNYKSGSDVSEALKTHKMKEILTGVEDFCIANEADIYSLSYGSLPVKYDNRYGANEVPICGHGSDSIYGNSKCSYLTASLIETQLTMLGENASIGHIKLSGYGNNWFNQAAVAHWEKLPKGFPYDTCEKFSFSYNYPEYAGLVYVHSGFCFRGH